jgi:hypothetical protein
MLSILNLALPCFCIIFSAFARGKLRKAARRGPRLDELLPFLCSPARPVPRLTLTVVMWPVQTTSLMQLLGRIGF